MEHQNMIPASKEMPAQDNEALTLQLQAIQATQQEFIEKINNMQDKQNEAFSQLQTLQQNQTETIKQIQTMQSIINDL